LVLVLFLATYLGFDKLYAMNVHFIPSLHMYHGMCGGSDRVDNPKSPVYTPGLSSSIFLPQYSSLCCGFF